LWLCHGARGISAIPFAGTPLHVIPIGPHFVQAPTSWNVELVDQPGELTIEAPIGSNYAKRAFALARSKFHKPVKGVITTSDSFSHIAGVRKAVAEGIPVYALDSNPVLHRRLVRAPHTLLPDYLACSPRQPRFISVANRTTIGAGSTRVEILPYRTDTAERQMMV
jgi:hypothetical protein